MSVNNLEAQIPNINEQLNEILNPYGEQLFKAIILSLEDNSILEITDCDHNIVIFKKELSSKEKAIQVTQAYADAYYQYRKHYKNTAVWVQETQNQSEYTQEAVEGILNKFKEEKTIHADKSYNIIFCHQWITENKLEELQEKNKNTIHESKISDYFPLKIVTKIQKSGVLKKGYPLHLINAENPKNIALNTEAEMFESRGDDPEKSIMIVPKDITFETLDSNKHNLDLLSATLAQHENIKTRSTEYLKKNRENFTVWQDGTGQVLACYEALELDNNTIEMGCVYVAASAGGAGILKKMIDDFLVKNREKKVVVITDSPNIETKLDDAMFIEVREGDRVFKTISNLRPLNRNKKLFYLINRAYENVDLEKRNISAKPRTNLVTGVTLCAATARLLAKKCGVIFPQAESAKATENCYKNLSQEVLHTPNDNQNIIDVFFDVSCGDGEIYGHRVFGYFNTQKNQWMLVDPYYGAANGLSVDEYLEQNKSQLRCPRYYLHESEMDI